MTNQWTGPRPMEDRFWEKVERWDPDGCWQWTASTCRGYGQLYSHTTAGRKKHLVRAHRFAYELLVGPIPDGLTLDHLCRNHGCVNPKHLEPVTRGENILRGEGFAAQQVRRTHCPRGHPYDGENTYLWRGQRHCRACWRFRRALRRSPTRKDATPARCEPRPTGLDV